VNLQRQGQLALYASCLGQEAAQVGVASAMSEQIDLPVVVRIPSFGGIGSPEHHSESPETYYAHTAGLKVVTPSTPADAYSLLREAIERPDPRHPPRAQPALLGARGRRPAGADRRWTARSCGGPVAP